MLAASIVCLYNISKMNFPGQSSDTTFLVVQFLALSEWLQCPRTCRRYRALHKTLFGGRFCWCNSSPRLILVELTIGLVATMCSSAADLDCGMERNFVILSCKWLSAVCSSWASNLICVSEAKYLLQKLENWHGSCIAHWMDAQKYWGLSRLLVIFSSIKPKYSVSIYHTYCKQEITYLLHPNTESESSWFFRRHSLCHIYRVAKAWQATKPSAGAWNHACGLTVNWIRITIQSVRIRIRSNFASFWLDWVKEGDGARMAELACAIRAVGLPSASDSRLRI